MLPDSSRPSICQHLCACLGSKSVTASRYELGLRTDNSWAMQYGIFTVRGRFALAHDFNIDRIVGATFHGGRRGYSSGFCRMMTLVPTGTRS
jgi:hypothetical protein